MTDVIFHLASPTDALELVQKGQYTCPSLDAEGFIHCCTSEQLPGVIQRYYADANALVLLQLEPGKLRAKLVFENTVGGTELFPHVYGVINDDAITHQVPLDQTHIAQISSSDSYTPH